MVAAEGDSPPQKILRTGHHQVKETFGVTVFFQ